ncbi:hypothetical protein Bbelb_428160 [Branchiostoma belcheri]|nr:hypothetical protein Bbelb_428160 [Branchiostoma belcheri]
MASNIPFCYFVFATEEMTLLHGPTICRQHRNEPGNRQEEGLSESSEKKERKATAVTQKRARLEANRQTAHPGSDLKARAPTTQAGTAALPPGVHPAPSTPLRPDCDHNRHQHHTIPQTDRGQFRGKRFLGSRAAKPREREGGSPKWVQWGPENGNSRAPGMGATGPGNGSNWSRERATHGAVHGHFLPCTGMYRDRVRAYNVQYTTCTQKVVHFRECTGHVRDWTRFVCRSETPGFYRKPKISGKYVAWVLVVMISVVSSFFVILYSLDWGREKSEAWLKTFFLSFGLSSIVAETGKILLLAAMFALVCSKTSSNKQRTYIIKKQELQGYLLRQKAPQKLNPPVAACPGRIKIKHEQRRKFFNVLKEFILLFLFVVILFFISHHDKDPTAFHASQTLSGTLLEGCNSITTADEFWTWGEEILLPVLYPSFWYNGWKMKYLDRQFPLYTEAFRIGPPLLTQHRYMPDAMATEHPEIGWIIATSNNTSACWQFNGTSGVSYSPACTTRFSIVLLNVEKSTATTLFMNLKNARWIDRYTDYVVLELSLYYPATKLFSSLRLTIEQEDIASILGSAAAIFIFGMRYHSASAALTELVEATGELGIDRFVDFSSTFWWDEAFKTVLAMVVFITTLTLLRVVRFSKTIASFIALPGVMKNDLIGFSIVSAIAFMAFSCSGTLVFGTHMKAYSSMLQTTFALFQMLLGSFSVEEILGSNKYVGPIFFTFFMILIFILLVNFLVTIICDAIASGAYIAHDHDQELSDYIWRSFQELFGVYVPPGTDEITAVPIGKYCAGADVLRESAGRCAGLPSGECGTSSGRVRYVLRESAVRPAGECGTFCGSQTFCSSLLEQRKLEVNDLRPACKQDWTGSGCNIKGAGGFC